MLINKTLIAEDKRVEVQTSEMFSVNWRDIRQAFIMTAIGAMVGPLIQSLEAWTIIANWKTILITGLTAGIAQIARKFFQPAQTIIKVTPPIEEPTVAKNERV